MSRKYVIGLDSGHIPGLNISPIDKSYDEAITMGKLAQYYKRELEKFEDIEVIMVREHITDDVSNTNRGKNARGADMLLSLHSNSAGESARGSLALVPVHASLGTQILANAIIETVASVMGNDPDHVKMVALGPNNSKLWYISGFDTPPVYATDYYGVINGALSVNVNDVVIIEHGFHTNPLDLAFLREDINLQLIAIEVAETISGLLRCNRKPLENPKTGGEINNPKTGAVV